MPIRSAYDDAAFGKPLPPSLDKPIDSAHPESDRLRGVSLDHEWEHATGAREWALFLLDEQGCVIAKHYQARGEEGTLPTLQYKRLDLAEWRIASGVIVGDREFDSLAAICKRLQFEGTGLPLGEVDLMRFEPALDDSAITPEAMLASLSRSYDSPDDLPSLGFRQSQRRDCQWPAHGQEIWQARRERDGSVTLRVENRIDISLVAWTAAGYAYILKTGELPY